MWKFSKRVRWRTWKKNLKPNYNEIFELLKIFSKFLQRNKIDFYIKKKKNSYILMYASFICRFSIVYIAIFSGKLLGNFKNGVFYIYYTCQMFKPRIDGIAIPYAKLKMKYWRRGPLKCIDRLQRTSRIVPHINIYIYISFGN